MDWELVLRKILKQYFYTFKEFRQNLFFFFSLFILICTKNNHDLTFQKPLFFPGSCITVIINNHQPQQICAWKKMHKRTMMANQTSLLKTVQCANFRSFLLQIFASYCNVFLWLKAVKWLQDQEGDSRALLNKMCHENHISFIQLI